MEFTEIIITYYSDSNSFNQIAFLIDGIYQSIEPFEFNSHLQYLKLSITRFVELKN